LVGRERRWVKDGVRVGTYCGETLKQQTGEGGRKGGLNRSKTRVTKSKRANKTRIKDRLNKNAKDIRGWHSEQSQQIFIRRREDSEKTSSSQPLRVGKGGPLHVGQKRLGKIIELKRPRRRVLVVRSSGLDRSWGWGED